MKRVIGGPGFIQETDSGTSGGTASGPLWTYVAGGSSTPASGTFTTDSANPSSGWGAIYFSTTSKSGSVLTALFTQGSQIGSNYILQNTTTNKSYAFSYEGSSVTAGVFGVGVNSLSAFTSFDAGDYTLAPFTGSPQATIFDGGLPVNAGDPVVFSDITGLLIGAASGFATVLAPGTYTLGLGVTTDGTATFITPGIVSSIQQAS